VPRLTTIKPLVKKLATAGGINNEQERFRHPVLASVVSR
jgi:hypothetical protein